MVVSSDTMIRTDEHPHARYSPCKTLRGENSLLLLIVPHEHLGSVLVWVNDHHLNFLPIFCLARGCPAQWQFDLGEAAEEA